MRTAVVALVMSAMVLGLASRTSAAIGPGRTEQLRLLLEAQDAYDRGIAELRTSPDAARAALRDAADRYALLVEGGAPSGRLHYNLANALLQSGELGRAILHYREAQRLRPGDARIENNLAYARSLCRDRIEPEGRRLLVARLLSWHRATSWTARFVVFAVAWVLFWCVLFSRSYRRWPGAIALLVATAGVVLACGASLAVETWRTPPDVGVVIADEVVVRKGNGEGFEPQFAEPIHEGVELEVIERRADWIHVELANGGRGWVPVAAVALLDRA